MDRHKVGIPMILPIPVLSRVKLSLSTKRSHNFVERLWDLARWGAVIAVAAFCVNFVRPYADSHNDGSRLAGIESVGLRGTLAIDDSVYARPQPLGSPNSPYRKENPHFGIGTMDKLYADGHYYSHQPPVPLVIGGAIYRIWLWLGGPDPAVKPTRFARGITNLTAVLPFAISVLLIGRLARYSVGLSASRAFVVTVAYGAGTMGMAYTRHVNGHILLLAVMACICSTMAAIESDRRMTLIRAGILGTWAGLAYCLDGALGPATVAAILGYVVYQRRWRAVLVVLGFTLPWIVAHHGLLYACTGDYNSPASNPKFWAWPGCQFKPENLTGTSLKHTPAGAAVYTYELLFGPRGFFWHNLPLFFALASSLAILIRSRVDRPVAILVWSWAALCTVPYFLASNTYSGVCLSIRWFLPLVAPAFWLIALALQRFPSAFAGFSWLTACSAVLGYFLYRAGPWTSEPVPYLYSLGILGLSGWAVLGVATSPKASQTLD